MPTARRFLGGFRQRPFESGAANLGPWLINAGRPMRG